MKGLGVLGAPLWPLLGDLTDSGIGAARDVAADSVVFYAEVFTLEGLGILKVGEELSLVVSNHDIARV